VQLAHILYDSALISAGFDIDDQAGFNKRMLKMVTSGLDIGDDAVVDEAPEVEEDDEKDEKEEEKEEGDMPKLEL
jgi:molecular chaperone HtpG